MRKLCNCSGWARHGSKCRAHFIRPCCSDRLVSRRLPNLADKLKPEKTWTKFQAHFIKAQADLCKLQKTSLRGGYRIADVEKNDMEMSIEFANMLQATAEDCAAETNLMTANRTLTEQVALYANRLYIREVDNMALQTAMINQQGGGVGGSRPKLPYSRVQATLAAPALTKRTGEDMIQSGR